MPRLTQSKTNSEKTDSRLYEFAVLLPRAARQPFMPDDHSKLAPLLPISNRTVKRLRADDSAGSRVKVGHRQAITARQQPPAVMWGAFVFEESKAHISKRVPACVLITQYD